MQETRVHFLGLEDPLEEEMATHSRILAWRIPWAEEPGGLQSMGLKESDTTEWLNHYHPQLSAVFQSKFLKWSSPPHPTYLSNHPAPSHWNLKLLCLCKTPFPWRFLTFGWYTLTLFLAITTTIVTDFHLLLDMVFLWPQVLPSSWEMSMVPCATHLTSQPFST